VPMSRKLLNAACQVAFGSGLIENPDPGQALAWIGQRLRSRFDSVAAVSALALPGLHLFLGRPWNQRRLLRPCPPSGLELRPGCGPPLPCVSPVATGSVNHGAPSGSAGGGAGRIHNPHAPFWK